VAPGRSDRAHARTGATPTSDVPRPAMNSAAFASYPFDRSAVTSRAFRPF